jgi:hypothetical protein
MKGMSDLDDEVSKMDRVGGGTLEQRIDGMEWDLGMAVHVQF